jgi:hypothetical protein
LTGKTRPKIAAGASRVHAVVRLGFANRHRRLTQPTPSNDLNLRNTAPRTGLWHEAKKDAKPILPAQRLHKPSTHPAQPAFLPGALFNLAVSHPFDNKAARRAALWLFLKPYFGFTTKSKPCLPLKNRPILHTTAALRAK